MSSEARKNLARLSSSDRTAIFEAIRELLLEDNPLSLPKVKKLISSRYLWRVRQGDYRIVFTLDTNHFVKSNFTYNGKIVISKIDRRSDIYKKR